MNKIMAFLIRVVAPITKLGGDKSWMIGKVRVHLWPFVAFAICLALLIAYDLVAA